MPSEGLNTNRFALVDGDVIFDTIAPKGKGPGRGYSLDGSAGSSTCGCSCEQILKLSTGEKEGHYKFGCSIGIMDDFVGSRCEVDGDRDGFKISDGDCDDSDPLRNPGATESCNGVDDDCDSIIPPEESDADGDGYRVCQGDCNDADALIHPDATEICDGIDNDCDGDTDEGAALTYYRDADGDGYGGTETAEGCSAPDGYIEKPGDCDDVNPVVYPGAEELCDGLDNDCDGDVPAGETDLDGDGYRVCQEDCDDSSPTVNPSATEICDGLDNDCDDLVDEEVQLTFYRDGDGDGAGGRETTLACSAPSGYVATSYDCDDADPALHPGATDTCDGIDNNCNLLVDDGFDADGDRYTTCAGDCNDSDPQINPGAAEVCDQKDNDCDTIVDEGFDRDGDGYQGWFNGCGTDYDDYDPLIHPGATEVCDGKDNDCDGEVDEEVQTVFYLDGDGDGSGATETVLACSLPPGASARDGDCDDADPERSPGVTESCDGKDNDCDEDVDEGFPVLTFYWDADGDGFGSTETIDSCFAPDGYVETGNDCDPADAGIYPGAEEVCDGKDNNCDGVTDEFLTSAYFLDSDGDGYGGTESLEACSAPAGYVVGSGDCDESGTTGPAVYPGAVEICDDLDNDCDAQVDEGLPLQKFYRDADGDGYGSTPSVETCSESLPGFVAGSTDCDDTDQFTYPAATELCDLKDNDCDGATDEGVTLTFYPDTDGDGFGDLPGIQACSAPAGYVGNSADCDDTLAASNPDMKEICDGKDNNCDGVADEGLDDDDGDGYSECTALVDCNDANSAYYPGAQDFACDSIDQNCDGHDDCDVRFKNYGGAILDVTTGLYWLRDANCMGPARYIEPSWDPTPSLVTRVSQLKSGQCGLTDDSSAGHWRIPTMAEMGSLFKKEHCQDAVWGLICDYCSDPYQWDGCLGNTAGTSRWLPGDPFIDVVTLNIRYGGDAWLYFSSDGAGPGKQYAVTFIDSTMNYIGGYPPTNRPPELYIHWEAWSVTQAGTTWQQYAWPVRDKLVDSDLDGHYRGPDCNDSDPAVHPGATESCDGIDNDCDGQVDETCDSDGDGYTPEEGDCNDSDAYIHPGAVETCDGIDNDCDGQMDEGVTLTFFRDTDADGYGGTATTQACTVPAGYVANSADCNDGDASTRPGATEVCDGKDNDCDGTTDEGVQLTFYRDADRDGYGGSETTLACTVPAGHSVNSEDCNDNNPRVNPGAPDPCDGRDNNCDGTVDEGTRNDYYWDRDRDGTGGSFAFSRCSAAPGTVSSTGDCNDNDWTMYPGATETCDGKDNDCDGVVDESEGLVCRFVDQKDGTILDLETGLYWLKNAGCLGGGPVTYEQALEGVDALRDGSCGLSDGSWAGTYSGAETKPPGYTFSGAWRMPTSEEMMGLCGYCGATCDLSNGGGTGPWREGDAFSNVKEGSQQAYWTGTPAEGGQQQLFRIVPMGGILHVCTDLFSMRPDFPVYFSLYSWPVRSALVDTDGDGYFVVEGTTNGPDCDDTNAAVHPVAGDAGAGEVCNRIDDNCAFGVDEICDWDGDGYTPLTGDCDDANANVHPLLPDPANGIDDNCDGKVDERFSIMGDGTVLDNQNHVRWLEDPSAIPPKTWAEAKAFVAALGDGTAGLSDGSKPGDWILPTVAEFNTLVNPAYAYDEDGDCQCEVLSLPSYYRKCWLDIPTGPALSNAQGNAHWEDGDPFRHVTEENPSCGGQCQKLCQHKYMDYGNFVIAWPWGECVGQPAVCNQNLFWTREDTIGAYAWFDLEGSGPFEPENWFRYCKACSWAWDFKKLGYFDDNGLWIEDPGGSCCIPYNLNTGEPPSQWKGHYCEDQLKVWPWRPA